MTWNVEKQKKYMKVADKSYREGRARAKKLASDANLEGRIYEGQYFLVEDALAEAFRAGAIDAIFGDD